MSRAEMHQYQNLAFASPTSVDTEVSSPSGLSFVSPVAGELLEVYQIDIDGRASNATTTGVEIRDGLSGDLIRFVEVAAGDTKVITFGGLPKKFLTTVWLQTVAGAEAVRAAVHYVPRKTRS